MFRKLTAGLVVCCCFALENPAEAQVWLDYVQVTDTNIVSTPTLGASDPEEKDYITGDFDLDGDPDVVAARKSPFTTFGPRPSVLFMNVDGVLIDQTAALAPAFISSTAFPTGANTRDVMIGYFNADIWPDLVFANAGNDSSPGQQPRIYINRGNGPGGAWLGFQEEPSRIPFLGTIGDQPNSCAVGVGDLTGDGRDEIYLVDYLNNLEDKLLINDGTGVFTEQTASRLPAGFWESGFPTAGMIRDLNGDGFPEIVKNTPGTIVVAYNNPANPGFFTTQQTMAVSASYHFDIGDLNNDGKSDFYVVQDGQDQFQLNNSAVGAIPVSWTSTGITSPLTTGFGGNVYIRNLDTDSDMDVVVTDTDTDVPGCNRRMAFLRNNGATPSPTLTDPYSSGTYIPAHHQGVYDVAVADFNGDGVDDVLVGHCSGTDLYYTNIIVPVDQVENLTCSQVVLNVVLTWVNGDTYTSLQVRRNGALIQTLGGTATTYTDVSPGAGNYSYTVTGVQGPDSANPTACVVQVATVLPVTGLVCSQVEENMQLSWANQTGVGGGAYTGVEVHRNGILLVTLPGSNTSYLDLAPPIGPTTYEVIALVGAEVSVPRVCTLSVLATNLTDLVVRFTQTIGGVVDSAAALEQALLDNSQLPVLVQVASLTELATAGYPLDAFQRVWLDLGTGPTLKHTLTVAEGAMLENFIVFGSQKSLFLSGGDTFCFDAPTAIHSYLGFDTGASCSDGTGTVLTVEGIVAASCDLMSFDTVVNVTGDEASVDRLGNLTTGQAVLRAVSSVGGVQFTAGVINEVLGSSRIISQSIELGGIGEPHDKTDLVGRYLNCFPPLLVGTQFVRGDANGDNDVNVADVITILDHLFSMIPADDCLSALDGNDDGGINIADGIFLLSYLFSSGTAPVEPFPLCGLDTTDDALECDTYTCP
ncbi:MAG: FG-GAP-like repeat-containing protein [Planctomycetota bacterium]